MSKNIILYNKYFGQTGFERTDLFELLRDKYELASAVYLGSFVHIAPAFVFQRTAFVDNDKRVKQFYEDSSVLSLVNDRKQYALDPDIFASQQDYEDTIDLKLESFDLLISQYAGFVSQAGKKYLRKGGVLIANDSHADATMAFLDTDYTLIGVANHSNNEWQITELCLSDYFLLKNGSLATKQEIEHSMKGPKYTRMATDYIFRRIS